MKLNVQNYTKLLMAHLITTEHEQATSRTATETHNYEYNLSTVSTKTKHKKVLKFMVRNGDMFYFFWSCDL